MRKSLPAITSESVRIRIRYVMLCYVMLFFGFIFPIKESTTTTATTLYSLLYKLKYIYTYEKN